MDPCETELKRKLFSMNAIFSQFFENLSHVNEPHIALSHPPLPSEKTIERSNLQ